jgi:hypothetical protein
VVSWLGDRPATVLAIDSNAALVGANTVNGPAPLSVVAKSALTTAPTSDENVSGLACAICTTLSTPGGTSTRSTTWTMPFVARTLAVVTVASPSTASLTFTPLLASMPSVAALPSKL